MHIGKPGWHRLQGSSAVGPALPAQLRARMLELLTVLSHVRSVQPDPVNRSGPVPRLLA